MANNIPNIEENLKTVKKYTEGPLKTGYRFFNEKTLIPGEEGLLDGGLFNISGKKAQEVIQDRQEGVREAVVTATEKLKNLEYFPEEPYFIANLGCGAGETFSLYDRLKEKFPNDEFRLIGYDLEEWTIGEARKSTIKKAGEKGREDAIENMEFYLFNVFDVLYDVNPPQTPEDGFHGVVISAVLQNYNDQECSLFLKASKEILRENGFIIIADAATELYSSFNRAFSTLFIPKKYGEARDEVFFTYRTQDEFKSIIEGVGLKVGENDHWFTKRNHIYLLQNSL